MSKRFKVITSVSLTTIMMATIMTGCFQKPGQKPVEQVSNVGGQVTYPLKTNIKLKMWSIITRGSKTYSDYAETPFAEELAKRTGVQIEYQSAPEGTTSEALNLLLASGDLPDLIQTDWKSVMGGPDKTIDDKIILQLNDVFDQYAPNLKKQLKDNPQVDRMVKTDSGKYYVFPFIRGDDKLLVYNGPMIRKDWLDEAKLEEPQTIDEWYRMLKTFKDMEKIDYPLAINANAFKEGCFVGAFGVKRGFYVEDSKVKYGPIELEYKDFLLTMNKWYAEGLIDKDFAIMDTKGLDSRILNGKAGATVGNLGGNMGKWLNSMKDKDGTFDLEGVQYPVLKKGDRPKFGHLDNPYSPTTSVAITTSCKNVDVAARFLDYGYSEEGHMLYNFGIEGESYNMVDGYPKYTDLIMKNPNNLTVSDAMEAYAQSSIGGPFVQDVKYLEQYVSLPQQSAAVNVWSETDAKKYVMPPVMPLQSESAELGKLLSDITTYENEMFLKFVMGVEPIDKFDQYVARIKDLKIDRVIKIYQDALDRYNKR